MRVKYWNAWELCRHWKCILNKTEIVKLAAADRNQNMCAKVSTYSYESQIQVMCGDGLLLFCCIVGFPGAFVCPLGEPVLMKTEHEMFLLFFHSRFAKPIEEYICSSGLHCRVLGAL